MKDLVDQMKRSIHLGTKSLSSADDEAAGDQGINLSQLFHLLVLWLIWKNSYKYYTITWAKNNDVMRSQFSLLTKIARNRKISVTKIYCVVHLFEAELIHFKSPYTLSFWWWFKDDSDTVAWIIVRGQVACALSWAWLILSWITIRCQYVRFVFTELLTPTQHVMNTGSHHTAARDEMASRVYDAVLCHVPDCNQSISNELI